MEANALSLAACTPIADYSFHFLATWGGPAISAAVLFEALAPLVMVVVAKSVVFSAIARIGAVRGFFVMLAANVVSSLPCVLMGVLTDALVMDIAGHLGAVPTWLFVMSFVFFLAYLAGNALYPSLEDTRWHWLKPWVFAGLTSVLAYVSAAVPFHFVEYLRSAPGFGPFVVVRAVGFFPALLGAIVLTSLWEGAIIATLTPNESRDHVLVASVRANYTIFFFLFLVAAVIMLPRRLANLPTYIVRGPVA